MNLETLISQTNIEPRPYQKRIVQSAVGMFSGEHRNMMGQKEQAARSVMIESPTGSGKSVMGLMVAKMMQEKFHLKVGWVAMRRNLLTQVEAENGIKSINVDPFTTISMFDKNPPQDLDFLVVDEAQHDAASSMSRIHNLIRPQWILGLTATPFRTDRVKLCFDKVIKDAGIHQLIQEGYLSQYNHYTIPAWTVDTVARHYLMEPDHWGKSIFFFHKLEECFALKRLFDSAGVVSDVVTGSSNREEQLENFRSGRCPVLINCMVLTEGFDCLSEDTEILTPSGWVSKDEVLEGDEMYSLNRESGLLEITPILSVAERELRDGERMVRFASQHIDIFTTEGHEFHIKYRDPYNGGRLSDNFITRTAFELMTRRSAYGLPISAELAGGFAGIDLTDDEIRLIAWSLTDSSFDRNSLCLHQSEKPSKHSARIRELLNRLDLDFRERYRPPSDSGYETEWGSFEFAIPAGTSVAIPRRGWKQLEPFIDADKNLSPIMREMTREQFIVLFDEMLLANGSRNEGKSGWLWHPDSNLVDTLQLMAIERGLTSMVTEEMTPAGKPIWRITVRDRQWMTSDPADQRATKIRFEEYDGRVWCVSNRNSTIVCRRNGKVAIVGNCPDLKTVFCRDSAKGPTMQMCGRAFRKHPHVPVKNIVQSKNTHQPFTKVAKPITQFLWHSEAEEWRSLTVNPLVNQIGRNMAMQLASIETKMPNYIAKNRGRRPGFWRGRP